MCRRDRTGLFLIDGLKQSRSIIPRLDREQNHKIKNPLDRNPTGAGEPVGPAGDDGPVYYATGSDAINILYGLVF